MYIQLMIKSIMHGGDAEIDEPTPPVVIKTGGNQ